MGPLDSADLDHVVGHTRPLWESLRGQRLFVTGGTGFFGCWLLESLLRADRELGLGVEAWVLTRRPSSFRARVPGVADDPAVRIVEGDVRSFAYPAGEFAAVVHAATESRSRLGAEHPAEMLDVLVEGTRRALDFARQSHAGRFLLVSSGAVYGRQPPSVSHLREDDCGGPDPTDPLSAYAEGKRVAELLCALAVRDRGLHATVARGFAFVGPHLPLDAHFAVGNFIRDGLAGGPIIVAGDGTPRRSYLYGADLAIWLWTILFRGVPGRAYNVGSEEDVSIHEVARIVSDAFSPKLQVVVRLDPVPGVPAQRYVPSVERAERELGLVARVGLKDAIARTIRWHSAQLAAGHPPCA